MPKNSDGIDNILIYFQDDQLTYRAGTDMVGKVTTISLNILKHKYCFKQYYYKRVINICHHH